ncbi:MAG: DNA polymerase III subunit delta [Deltaproteobacteria bacterium]|nr:DNA polymerase III subunit delta [Deltaproteobacteria bacterium]
MIADRNFEQSLQEDSLSTVYALIGSESILVSEAVSLVRQKTLTAAADFNKHEFSARETPIIQAIEAARTMPMMAPKRFVHVSSIDFLKSAEQAPLLAYLEQPSNYSVLCLSGSKLDQRTKLGQKLAKMGALFTFEPPRQQELSGYIEKRARKIGYRINHDATQLLGDLIGVNVGNIDRALEKLALYSGNTNPISAEDVEVLIAPTRVHSIFELTDAIGNRELDKAAIILRNILAGGESALAILGMITRQFRQLLQIKTLASRRASNQEIVSTLGIRPFLINSLLTQARRYTINELTFALDAALQTDIKLKSSKLPPGVALDRMLVAIASYKRNVG